MRLPLNSAVLAHTTGLLAGYLVAVLLVLMSRAPVLEHRIGPDILVRWHARGGRTFLILVLIHAGAAMQSWASPRKQNLLASSIAVLSLPGLVAATVRTALFIAIAVISIRSARRQLSYETWHGIHLLTYLAIGLSFAHMLAGPGTGTDRDRSTTWIQVCSNGPLTYRCQPGTRPDHHAGEKGVL